MTYRLNQGVSGDNETVQRGLLIGLPAIAILLSFGAIAHHQPSDNPVAGPKVIPVVSALSHSADKSSGTNNGSAATKNKGSGANGTSSTGSGVPGGNTTSYSISSAPTSSGSGITTIVGGRGGGPSPSGTSTTSGGSDSGSTSSTGSGGSTLPLNTTLTIPPVSAGVGDKSLVDTSGTTITIN